MFRYSPLLFISQLFYSTPSNADLDKAVQELLRVADLNLVPKMEIRRHLEEKVSMDLTSRKTATDVAIDRTLLGQA